MNNTQFSIANLRKLSSSIRQIHNKFLSLSNTTTHTHRFILRITSKETKNFCPSRAEPRHEPPLNEGSFRRGWGTNRAGNDSTIANSRGEGCSSEGWRMIGPSFTQFESINFHWKAAHELSNNTHVFLFPFA